MYVLTWYYTYIYRVLLSCKLHSPWKWSFQSSIVITVSTKLIPELMWFQTSTSRDKVGWKYWKQRKSFGIIQSKEQTINVQGNLQTTWIINSISSSTRFHVRRNQQKLKYCDIIYKILITWNVLIYVTCTNSWVVERSRTMSIN